MPSTIICNTPPRPPPVDNPLTPESRPALVAGARLQWDAKRHVTVMLHPEGVVELNESAAEVVKLCDGERTVQGVIQSLSLSYDGTPEDFYPDVMEVLLQLLLRKHLRLL